MNIFSEPKTPTSLKHLYMCVCVYIWNIISLSHKCSAALYLGCKLSDYNIHHWSQTPECTSHSCCSHSDLMAKHAEGCSPEPDWKEGA